MFAYLYHPQGNKFEFKDDWGEQLVSKCSPILAIFDVIKEEITVLDGVPNHLSAGQVGNIMSERMISCKSQRE